MEGLDLKSIRTLSGTQKFDGQWRIDQWEPNFQKFNEDFWAIFVWTIKLNQNFIIILGGVGEPHADEFLRFSLNFSSKWRGAGLRSPVTKFLLISM